MSKKKSSTRVISSSIHKDFAVFSKCMVNDYHLTKEQVNTIKHVDGKLVKRTTTAIVNETY